MITSLSHPSKGQPSVAAYLAWSEPHCASLGSVCIKTRAVRLLLSYRCLVINLIFFLKKHQINNFCISTLWQYIFLFFWRWQYFILKKSFCPIFGKQNWFLPIWASDKKAYLFRSFVCMETVFRTTFFIFSVKNNWPWELIIFSPFSNFSFSKAICFLKLKSHVCLQRAGAAVGSLKVVVYVPF